MSKSFDIIPLKSVSGVPFGADREDVREAFGGNFVEFKKTDTAENTADGYEDCNVYYTADNTLRAVEIFCGTEVNLDGRVLLPDNFTDIAAFLKQLDSDLDENNDGIISSKLGIGVYAPNGVFENIIAASEGYFY